MNHLAANRSQDRYGPYYRRRLPGSRQQPFRAGHHGRKRARQLARGAEAHLPWGNHKSTVLALQEIAAGHVTESVLDEQELPAIQAPKMELEALDPSFDL